jgi:hypothetical protein
MPLDTIIDMLLHLKNEELASPLLDTLDHATHTHVANFKCKEHNTETMINLSAGANPETDNKWDPPTLQHAKQSKYWNKWLTAMHEELEALKAKEVYEEVKELPHGRKAVWCKWVLHIKWDKDRQISCFKGHLVAKGFTQIPRQDYTLTSRMPT